jgi:hypothetical protein
MSFWSTMDQHYGSGHRKTDDPGGGLSASPENVLTNEARATLVEGESK